MHVAEVRILYLYYPSPPLIPPVQNNFNWLINWVDNVHWSPIKFLKLMFQALSLHQSEVRYWLGCVWFLLRMLSWCYWWEQMYVKNKIMNSLGQHLCPQLTKKQKKNNHNNNWQGFFLCKKCILPAPCWFIILQFCCIIQCTLLYLTV